MAKTTVSIRKREIAKGRISLYLDIYAGTIAEVDCRTGKLKYRANRYRKSLGLTLIADSKNSRDRFHNKNTEKLAEEMRKAEELKLLSANAGDVRLSENEIDFYEFYDDFIESYPKADLRQVKRALKQFKDYLSSTRRFKHLTKRLEFKVLTKSMVEGYAEYLKKKFQGEGPHTVFARFKKVIKRAVDEGYMTTNPCNGVVIPCGQGQLVKDTLTPDEIRTLIQTHYKGENLEVRRAFLFCLLTGIRGCDVRLLTYHNISIPDCILKFNQRKTEGRSSASLVTIPLTKELMSIIGQPETDDKNELIFNLPSDTTCNIKLKMWTKAAQIDKHITWHCARHSFGTNLSEKDVNPMTIMTLMGHSSLKYTNVYVRVRDKVKAAAMKALTSDYEMT